MSHTSLHMLAKFMRMFTLYAFTSLLYLRNLSAKAVSWSLRVVLHRVTAASEARAVRRSSARSSRNYVAASYAVCSCPSMANIRAAILACFTFPSATSFARLWIMASRESTEGNEVVEGRSIVVDR